MIFNKRFGRYTLVKKLAMGGMAEVYLGLKRGPDRFEKLVALKMLHTHLADDPAHVEMFYREARLGGVFDHPNLIRVFDADVIDSRHAMLMEFVPGQTVEALATRLRERGESLPAPMALAIVSDAANGLHHAHTARDLDGTALNVVHRDISPQNILVGHDGSVRVFDFGVAVASTASGQGQLAGKTAYMSPEQCRGKNVDARSDVFALGIVLHELLCGQPLFKRENHIKSIRAITEEDAPAPSTLREGLDPAIDAIVSKALSREVADRYASAWELHVALADYLAHHELVVHEREVAALVDSQFKAENEEISAVVQKILLAPEQSDATIDLSTFDLKAAAKQADVGIQTRLESDGGDSPLAKAASESLRPASAPLDGVANAALMDQLSRARRRGTLLTVVALFAVALALAAWLRPRPPAMEAAAPVAAGPSLVEVPVESIPPGATITVDGVDRGERTPARILLAGDQSVVLGLSLDGYVSQQVPLTPSASNPTAARVTAELQIDPDSALAPIGAVRIVVNPPDAEVFVDGDRAGAGSPVLVEGLVLNREHQLRVAKQGYETLHFPVTLDNADILEIQLDLAEAVELGTVTITSRPPRAEVFINGDRVGETPIERLELPANQTYTVEVRRAGAPRWRRAIVLRAGADETLLADLGVRDDAAEPTAAPATGEPATGRPATPTAEPTPTPEPEPVPEPEPEPRYQLLTD
ncbi:MAG: serine/threonine protein kinase [Myxococcales bacterium]|nr:serine/threonine protein kinase [Myxococcales bacterium]MCB9532997.1 serine/threonine protein kinase [Myxococcales bacterium]